MTISRSLRTRDSIHASRVRVRFKEALLPGVLVARYKRFFADVRLADGSLVTTHCANPGSMKSCLELGGRVWISRAENPKRKLKYTWELAEVAGERVFVNPLRANDVCREAIKRGRVQELQGYSILRREVPYGQRSRIDFLLSGGASDCYVEVKNMTLSLGGGRAAFPDSITERGKRHLEEMLSVVHQGKRAVLLFCVARTGVRSAEPADEIDVAYADTLRRVVREGVEVIAYRCAIDEQQVILDVPLPVLL